jgi:hypothetical protein
VVWHEPSVPHFRLQKLSFSLTSGLDCVIADSGGIRLEEVLEEAGGMDQVEEPSQRKVSDDLEEKLSRKVGYAIPVYRECGGIVYRIYD